MTYGTLTLVQARIPARGGQTSFAPLTDDQATDILEGVSGDIDGKLAGCGYTVPVTSPQSAVDYLTTLAVWGTAAELLKAIFRSASGPNGESAHSFYEKRYGARFDKLCEWAAGALGGAAQPSSYTTLNPDEDSDLGANAEPRLTMGMEF